MTPKKKLEFSKILVILVTVYFFLTLTIALVFWMITGRVLPWEIFAAIAGPFASVTGFYLFKSGWENSARNSSCNYNPNYGQQSYYPQSYSNTMYSGTMYGQSNRYNTPYQYNQPARY
jgi:hypothetical protein